MGQDSLAKGEFKMWRKFRYYLRKKFPDIKLEVEKVDTYNYKVIMPDLQVHMFFGYSNQLKGDESSIKVMVDSLYSGLKNQMFMRRKIKNQK